VVAAFARRSLAGALEGWRTQLPKNKKIGVVIRGDTSISRGVSGLARAYAKRVERMLKANGALPTHKSQRWIIGSLGALDHHVVLLNRALRAFVSPNRRGSATFEHRLLDLASQVQVVSRFSTPLARSLNRMVEKRCGAEGEVEALLRGAATMLESLTGKEFKRGPSRSSKQV
jgi:hypothetical protein